MLHVVYRSYGGENAKGRPPYYSKLLALTSMVRAAELAGEHVHLVFLNDGPIPADRLAVMVPVGEIVARDRLGFRGSYHAGLALPLQRYWPDGDLVLFAEDDYLYLPHALRDLLAAARSLPQADYLALFAPDPRPEDGIVPPGFSPFPPGWVAPTPVLVNGRGWRRALSTTWSFGVRMQALRRDHAILSRTDWAGLGGCDHAMCLHYQGERPYPWPILANDLLWRNPGPVKIRAKRFLISPVRAAMNLWSYRRAGAGHRLWAAEPPLSTHLETALLAPGTDWEAVASDCAAWGASRGIAIRLPAGVAGADALSAGLMG